ncbi:MAG: hypothetical protein A2270_06825 [Elusimicrobia bacterium RIFOXYA12_FULL_51_18]|nr:MAG: hypothetical protein A2270_06825 [Elusimicrobia bacterium RIFOXYA12_FULL_51_18]OGS28399.1 MAG: hypothetical protein A2218_05130 [Elusimicrobia bacterium RIFOXYA2_FULL_53_38]
MPPGANLLPFLYSARYFWIIIGLLFAYKIGFIPHYPLKGSWYLLPLGNAKKTDPDSKKSPGTFFTFLFVQKGARHLLPLEHTVNVESIVLGHMSQF